jgi:hypothetical protein
MLNKIEVETSCQRRPLLWHERQLTCHAYQGKTLESVTAEVHSRSARQFRKTKSAAN